MKMKYGSILIIFVVLAAVLGLSGCINLNDGESPKDYKMDETYQFSLEDLESFNDGNLHVLKEDEYGNTFMVITQKESNYYVGMLNIMYDDMSYSWVGQMVPNTTYNMYCDDDFYQISEVIMDEKFSLEQGSTVSFQLNPSNYEVVDTEYV